MFHRRIHLVSLLGLAVVHGVLLPSAAGAQVAQVIGTFSWQFAPFCNVATLAVTQVGSAFVLGGFDDQCGGGRAPVSGMAFVNPNGSIGLGLSIIATPGAAPVHVNVTVGLGSIGGPWRDSAGNSGTFVFNPASPAPGTPRPPTGGLISSVTSGPGLNGGGVTGPVSLSVDFAGPGTAVTVARSDHTHAVAGSSNVAVGPLTLGSVTTGGANSGFGSGVLRVLTTGLLNTAVGAGALQSVTTGIGNTALGAAALVQSTGDSNVAVGFNAMAEATTGQQNVAVGASTLAATSGTNNTALGTLALYDTTTGSSNVAIGAEAGFQLTSGNSNIYISHRGPSPAGSESGHIRIGTPGNQTSTYIAGIRSGSVDGNSDAPVLVDATGKLGHLTSSARFKQDVRPLDDIEGAVLRLEPVSFRYTAEQMRGDAVQFGLIAEQVAEVIPELVIRDENGQPYSVKYHVLPTLLLAEIQRLERERASQAREIQELRQQMRVLLQRQQ